MWGSRVSTGRPWEHLYLVYTMFSCFQVFLWMETAQIEFSSWEITKSQDFLGSEIWKTIGFIFNKILLSVLSVLDNFCHTYLHVPIVFNNYVTFWYYRKWKIGHCLTNAFTSFLFQFNYKLFLLYYNDRWAINTSYRLLADFYFSKWIICENKMVNHYSLHWG